MAQVGQLDGLGTTLGAAGPSFNSPECRSGKRCGTTVEPEAAGAPHASRREGAPGRRLGRHSPSPGLSLKPPTLPRHFPRQRVLFTPAPARVWFSGTPNAKNLNDD